MYDTIIVGAGPAGLTAGLYLARAGFKTLILEKETIGGQIASAPLVENYPGFIKISGADLANNMYEQAINAGAEVEIETVVGIHNGDTKKVMTEDASYEAKTIIIASGSKYRKLGLDAHDKYLGNGVHFCTSCDGAFYKGKTVAVIGGGNTAATNALYLAEIATKVYLIYRGEDLKCEKTLKEELTNKGNIEILYNSTVENLFGEEALESIQIKTKEAINTLSIDGLFESIGMDAQTELIDELLERNEANYIVSTNCETKVPGLFVAGDCREKDIRQLTTAVADGTLAAYATIKFLRKK